MVGECRWQPSTNRWFPRFGRYLSLCVTLDYSYQKNPVISYTNYGTLIVGNNYKIVFSLHVVESVIVDYNFQLLFHCIYCCKNNRMNAKCILRIRFVVYVLLLFTCILTEKRIAYK